MKKALSRVLPVAGMTAGAAGILGPALLVTGVLLQSWTATVGGLGCLAYLATMAKMLAAAAGGANAVSSLGRIAEMQAMASASRGQATVPRRAH